MAVTDKIYTPDDYNQHNVLKVPSYLPLILAYLLRYPVLYIVPYVPAMNDAEFLKAFAAQQFNWSLLPSVIPILLVVYALVRRIPEGGRIARLVWARGRELLLFAVTVNILSVLLYTALDLKGLNDLLVVFTYLDVLLLVFFLRSKRLRDLFSEFPEAEKNAS